jgi:hypothetical protein
MELLTSTARFPRRFPLLRLVVAAAVGALGLLAGPRAGAAPAISDEYRIKAVFLFNFAQFVEWPPTAFSTKDAPLVIGVIGPDPFGAYLDDLVAGEKVRAHPLVVRRPVAPEEIAACHILFVSRSESAALGPILRSLGRRSILTIGDADNFTREGGMVRFVTENGKIRLRINVDAAKACGLTVSSKIIRPATVVTAGKD